MPSTLVTGPSEQAGATRAPNSDAHGPQGAALVLELQRLRRAFDGEIRRHHAGSHGQRPPSDASARASDPQAGKSKRRRRKKSRLGRIIDFCLVQFGLKSPSAQEGIAQDEIPIAPHQAGHGLVSHHPLSMDLTNPAPAIETPQLKLSPSLAPAKTVERVLRIGGASLVAATSFLLGRNGHDGAIDAADASLLTRAGRLYENELRTGLRVLLVVTLLGGGWLALVPLAGAVVVPGNLVVQSNVKSIQHPTGGVVAEIKVTDGARVAAGDLLLRLDATQVQASLQIVSKQLDEARARGLRG